MSSKFKNTLVSMLFSVLAFGVTAQKRAMSFNDYGPERVLLDSLYQNAMNADSTRAVFGDRQEAFMVAWPEFLAELAHYLKDHDFQWGAPTRCFARIYFADTGRVDLFCTPSVRGLSTGRRRNASANYSTVSWQHMSSH